MGVEVEMKAVQFSGIVSALQAGHCDAIASGLFITPERKAEVDFAVYGQNGNYLMVPVGNPQNITGLDDSLAGRTIGIQSGYTVVPVVQAFCKKLDKQGKPACNVVLYPSGTDLAEALKTNKVDVAVDGATAVAYRVTQNPTTFASVRSLITPVLSGIAVRKDDADLGAAFQKAIDMLYANGTMCKILNKWEIGFFASPGNTC